MSTPNILTPLLISVSVMLLVTGCQSPDGDAWEGKRWFTMHNCSSCHGQQGKDGRAAELAGLTMSFSRFERILRTPPTPSMPSFSKEKLPREDVADIYVWLKSIE